MTDKTSREIGSQPKVWQQALEVVAARRDVINVLWERGQYDSIIFIGCGSTHYLALAAAETAQTKLGIPARAAPSSALLLSPDAVLVKGSRPLLVTISRSGTTTETIRAARLFREQRGDHVLNISCYEDRPLNAEANLTLAIPAAQEQSLAQTRSFSSMLLVAEQLIDALAGKTTDVSWIDHDAPRLVESAYNTAESLIDPDRFSRFYFLGSGPLYGLACEAMIKMTEMSQTTTHAYHTLEIRHGPMSMVGSSSVVVGLFGGHHDDYERAVLDNMRQLGASTVTVSDADDADFVLPKGGSLVRYLPLVQYMAYHQAIKKNLNPDQPHNLVMSIEL